MSGSGLGFFTLTVIVTVTATLTLTLILTSGDSGDDFSRNYGNGRQAGQCQFGGGKEGAGGAGEGVLPDSLPFLQ